MHLGIIPDGNRRAAEEKGISVFEVYQLGAEKIEEVSKWCDERDIKYLSFYIFSSENWKRPREEISLLMNLTEVFIKENLPNFYDKNFRFRVLGERRGIPGKLVRLIKEAEESTEKNSKMTINLLFNYGGRNEIVEAVKKIVKNRIKVKDIDEDEFSKFLYAPDIPDPDLIIRTSGEKRLSNFFTWQSSYSEFYFSNPCWPDFSEKELDKAIEDYQKRKKRFGK